MIKEILLPDLGEGIETVDVSEVLVSPGDNITPGDIILVLESEKASMEIPAEVAGEVKDVMVKTGEEVVTGQILVKIELSQTQIEKEPYPKRASTISLEAIIKPRLAGIENKKHNSIDLFCMLLAS